MIAYIYDKYSLNIENKIDNVTSVQEYEINGDSKMKFGSGSNYIILQSDTINKSIGQVIDISNLEDCRDFFLLSKDAWYLEQLKKQFNTITEQQNKISDLSSDNISTMLAVTELYEMTLS